MADALNDPNAGTSVTVGVLRAGEYSNAVPASGEVEIDVRADFREDDGFGWPQRDGLKWSHLALVSCAGQIVPEGRRSARAESSPEGRRRSAI